MHYLNNGFIEAWHVTLTEHQIHPYLAIERMYSGMSAINTFKKTDGIREAQGWIAPKNSEVVCNDFSGPFGLYWALKYIFHNRDKVHMFGSVFEKFSILVAFLFACFVVRKVFLITEPYADTHYGYFSNRKTTVDKIKSFFRPICYHTLALIYRNKISGVLAISEKARLQFIKMGVNSSIVHRYGYFVPKKLISNSRDCFVQINEPLRLIFVGSIIPIKGVSLLINAVKELRDSGFAIELDLYGPKDRETEIIESNGIRYKGVIPFGDTEEKCREYNYLVLPSVYDGWGVVVNEALNAGIGVVCSSGVGAKILVEELDVGFVFENGDSTSLKNVLALCVEQAKLGFPKHDVVKKAQEYISPNKAGSFLFNLASGNEISDFYND